MKKRQIAAFIMSTLLCVSMAGCSGGGNSASEQKIKEEFGISDKEFDEIKNAVNDELNKETKTTTTARKEDTPKSEDTAAQEETPEEPAIEKYDDPSIVYSPVEDFEYWYEEKEGGVMIRGYIGEGGDVVIPKEIEGEPVTIIDEKAFQGNKNIVSLYIPSSVETIDNFAFSESSVKSVTMGQGGVKRLNQYAFSKCKDLEEINLPEGLEIIGKSCFSECSSLKSIVIPDTAILEVKDRQGTKGQQFFKCASLESVVLSKSMTIIPIRAFQACHNLKTIEIPEGITEISDSAFGDCSSLDGITLPKTLEKIRESAFSNCVSLTELEIPPECKPAITGCFYNCPNIKAKYKGKTYTADNIYDLY